VFANENTCLTKVANVP